MTHFNFQTLYSNIEKFDIFILHRKSKHTLGKEKKYLCFYLDLYLFLLLVSMTRNTLVV